MDEAVPIDARAEPSGARGATAEPAAAPTTEPETGSDAPPLLLARRPRVVVVGGGFGGIHTVRQLAKADCEVVLIDRKNHHVFQPLLYQVATAALSPADIAGPIRGVFSRQKNVQVALGEVSRVDLENRVVYVGSRAVRYDFLVLAAGVTHTYFGNPDWEVDAPGLKTLDDAITIRRRMLLAFERAEFEEDAQRRGAELTFVVVGGGPTGVEMAGALREIATRTVVRDFRRVDTSSSKIIVVEGADRVLPGMSEAASKAALEDLRSMGVEVRLNTFVTEVTEDAVYAGDERIPAKNVIWAAGVKAVGLASTLGVEQDRQGRVVVQQDCSVPGYPEVFVVGDLACLTDPRTDQPVPGVAQAAMQMGDFVGAIVAREVPQREVDESGRGRFLYRDKGNMATIGRARAVADIGGRTYRGLFAWILWSMIHVLFLIGYRNKILVLVNWIWQWLLQARGARLITDALPSHVHVRLDARQQVRKRKKG